VNFQIKQPGSFGAAEACAGVRALLVRGLEHLYSGRESFFTASFDKSLSDAPSQLVALKADFKPVHLRISIFFWSASR